MPGTLLGMQAWKRQGFRSPLNLQFIKRLQSYSKCSRLKGEPTPTAGDTIVFIVWAQVMFKKKKLSQEKSMGKEMLQNANRMVGQWMNFFPF